jgi:hypothetical protein
MVPLWDLSENLASIFQGLSDKGLKTTRNRNGALRYSYV